MRVAYTPIDTIRMAYAHTHTLIIVRNHHRYVHSYHCCNEVVDCVMYIHLYNGRNAESGSSRRGVTLMTVPIPSHPSRTALLHDYMNRAALH